MIRYGSVCSGFEAASVAWGPLGWKPAFFSEIEAYPRAVLAARHRAVDARAQAAALRGVALWGDFTTIRPRNLRRIGVDPNIDVLVGGTPCQDFSVAGQRAGIHGARGNLTREFAVLARRMRPRWLVWENVPGVFSLNRGRDFGAVLAAFAGYPDGTLFEPPADGWKNSGVAPPAHPNGYGLAWRVLDAQYFGVPQRRRRVFVVGYIGDWRPTAAALVERDSLAGNPAPRRGAREDVAGTFSARTAGGGGFGTDFECNGGLVPVLAGTLCAHSFSGGMGGKIEGEMGSHLVPQVFGGNNTSGPVDVSPALNAHGGGSRRLDFETEAFVASVAPTLRSMAHRDSHSNAGGQIAVAGRGSVRRLSVRECDRLQGFPDDYSRIEMTRITRDGAMVPKWRPCDPDEGDYLAAAGYAVERRPNGRTYTTAAADGPCYKGLGNSMAVPVMRFIGERIAAVEAALMLRGAAE